MLPISIELPEGFLDEEVRNDYLISEKMKKVWAVQLDLLVQLDSVCKKHNLEYFADSGTLIGAIRHGGYIPWDDDIDIVMKREDYNKLVEIAPLEFEYPYFLQNAYSDEFIRGFSRLRNSETTAIGINDVRLNCNKGIFIDIFPLDRLPTNFSSNSIWIKLLKSIFNLLRVGVNSSPKYYSSRIKIIQSYLLTIFFSYIDYRLIYNLFEKICMLFSKSQSGFVSYVSFTFGKRNNILEECSYTSAIDSSFEFLNICIPKGFHEVLSIEYGDYLKPVKTPPAHGTMIFDPETNYLEFERCHTQKEIEEFIING